MTPDDPRHGKVAGYSTHKREDSPVCTPCRLANNEYERQRSYDRVLGRTRLHPTHGFVRRLRALQALGWSIKAVAEHMGTTLDSLHRSASYEQWITDARYQLMVSTFEELCMEVPTDRWAPRRRSIAAKKGYVPPLAWDDIDDPDEQPSVGDLKDTFIDEVKVQRVLSGTRQECTPAERAEIIRRFEIDGENWTELERITGWNIHRERKKAA